MYRSARTITQPLPVLFPFARLSLSIDGLSAYFLLVISVVTIAAAIYGPAYLRAHSPEAKRRCLCAARRGSASPPYRPDDPQRLESDLRTQHLSLDVTRGSENPYGLVYEIEGPIRTPNGRIVRFCSVWQVDTGTDVPRFITMYAR